MRFDRFMELALYDPIAGFYSSGGAAGRRGDFITSPEVGPLFGAVIARYLDDAWRDMGEPTHFVVAEAAAGVGTLARAVLAAEPGCRQALRYVLVETSAQMRAQHDDLVARGCESRNSWPEGGVDVGLANELLDNMPARVLERSLDGWSEVCVDGDLGYVCVPPVGLASEPGFALLEVLVDQVDIGARVPWAQRAARWVEQYQTSTRHSLVAVDYGADTADLAKRGRDGWLRGYRGHGRVESILEDPGSADITIDVPFDQLPQPTTLTTQADWLRSNGLESLLEQAETVWQDRAGIGDLAALKARSALTEAAALTDPEGLGGFMVAEWRK